MHYFTVNTVAEWICFLTALVCLRRDKDPVWRRFPFYLLLVCLVETGGIFMRTELKMPNAPIYNVYMLAECFAMTTFLYHLIKPYGMKIWVPLAWGAIFLAAWLVESLDGDFGTYSRQTAILLSIAVVVACLYYFYLVLRDDRYVRLATHPPFWWVSGTLMFYFGGIATYIFFQYLLEASSVEGIRFSLRYVIFKVLNVLLYGSWTYAFICRYRQTKY
ncbi:hypothetical protein [Chitinophaga caseinilytica]|uniref:Uncharacterized protein n=1 Tax=Chitinophaga caseinilytica TaxID=2267521 RepID=A0ABZ2YYH0_9BACT